MPYGAGTMLVCNSPFVWDLFGSATFWQIRHITYIESYQLSYSEKIASWLVSYHLAPLPLAISSSQLCSFEILMLHSTATSLARWFTFTWVLCAFANTTSTADCHVSYP